MKKYVVEGLGSFFLTLIFLVTANVPALYTWMPFAYAAFVIAIALLFHPISGAHFNPIMTFTAFLRGQIDRIDTIYYILAQGAGGVGAAVFATLLLSVQGVTDLNPQAVPAFTGLLCELMGAFLLACASAGGPVAVPQPWKAALLLPALMYAFRGVSGGFFNPVLAFSSMIIGRIGPGDWWLYLLAAAMGTGAAVTFLRATEEV
jgi:glycerol uptake facilitator-like aquaporin